MIYTIAITKVFGLPLVLYGGLITLLLVIFTATIGFLNFKRTSIIPFKWHPIFAIITVTVAIIHGILGLSFFFGF